MVNQDRNIFAAALLALGEADAMITGVTRPFSQSLRQVRRVLDDEPGATPFGIHVMVGQSHTVFIADTTVTERPTAEQLAAIAIQTAGLRAAHGPRAARRLPHLFHLRQSAGHAISSELRDAVQLLDGAQGRLRI